MIHFFTKEQERRIIAAIREAEGQTSGEIRVHLERELIGDVLTVATRVFHQLEMDKTKDRNGVLIFIVPPMHRFAIIGDKGINDKVPAGFWDEVRDLMEEHFRQGLFAEGVVKAIHLTGQKLKAFFPNQMDDKNELPDTISYG